ncbi:hypothetical protein ACJX0J_032255, partial [Zea mays]
LYSLRDSFMTRVQSLDFHEIIGLIYQFSHSAFEYLALLIIIRLFFIKKNLRTRTPMLLPKRMNRTTMHEYWNIILGTLYLGQDGRNGLRSKCFITICLRL